MQYVTKRNRKSKSKLLNVWMKLYLIINNEWEKLKQLLVIWEHDWS
jgi:hypothetical protein